jgi:hypothetical protein
VGADKVQQIGINKGVQTKIPPGRAVKIEGGTKSDILARIRSLAVARFAFH